MLFLNSGTRNPTVTGVSMRDRSVPQKMGQSCIIFGCLSIVIGLILIVIGIISEVKKTIFIGIGIISLGVGFFLTTIVCFYGKLDIYYNNWAYRSRVLPTNNNVNNNNKRHEPVAVDTERRPSRTEVVNSIPKRTSIVPIESQSPITIISDAEIHKIVISSSTPIRTD